MTDLYNACLFRAKELLKSGEVARVIGWRKGEFSYDVSPAFFETEEQLKDFTYDYFCGANLSKYLVEISKKEGVTAVFLKPCDTYSFNELVKEHRVARDKIRVIAVECRGKVDYKKAEKAAGESVLAINETDDTKTLELVTESGRKTVERFSVLLDKCLACKGKQHVASDETIILKDPIETGSDRFAGVEALEKMSAAERTFALHPLQRVPQRMPRVHVREVRVRQPRIGHFGKGERYVVRRTAVSRHPRVPRSGALHRLRRVFAGMSAGNSSAPFKP